MRRSPFSDWLPKQSLRHCTAGLRAWLNSAEGSPPPLVFRTVRATFAAHGSSVDGALVMSTQQCGEFMLSTMNLIMAVTVHCCKIAVSVVTSLSIQMVNLDQSIR